MEIYAYAREFMARKGNPNQWGPTNWPPEALIHNDIIEGTSYVCLNGGNKVMQNLLTKLGFVHCGTIFVEEDDYPRLAYEKINKSV